MRRNTRFLPQLALALGAAASAYAAPRELSKIHLKSGDVTVSKPAFERLLAELDRKAGTPADGNLHLLVQLDRDLSAAEREAWRAEGLELGDYAGDGAWIAAVPAGRAGRLLRRPEIRFATAWSPERKLDPEVRAGRFSARARHPKMPGRVKLLVTFARDLSLEKARGVVEALGAIPLEDVSSIHGFALWLPEGRIGDLSALEGVLWIGEEPPALSPLNDGVVVQTRARLVQDSPYKLDGDGTRVFVYDDGTVDDSHPTFDDGNGSRVKRIDNEPVSDHPTHVAGTLAGDGSDDANGGTRGRGVAPAAQLFSAGVAFGSSPVQVEFLSNLGDLEKDYEEAANQNKVDVANNSIGLAVSGGPELNCGPQGDYGNYSRAVDNIIAGKDPKIERPLSLVWAVGNERGHPECGTDYTTIGPPGCAKNIVGVGAIHSDGGSMTVFSGWGPCDDGSLKPTIVSPGCETGRVTKESGIYSSIVGGDYSADAGGAPWCGTSMAAPSVTGTIALLIEDWRKNGHGDDQERPLPALVRAMLAHTAHDRGPVGPDYVYGFGLLDAKELIDLERADDGKLGNGDRPQWGTDTIVKPPTVRTYSILVPADLPSFKATLAWDDPAPPEFVQTPLVNDLTLELISPSGVHFQAWTLDPAKPELPAARAGNDVDTLEQVVVDDPEQGSWTVQVSAASLPEGPQPFGLVYSWQAQLADTCTSEGSDFESGAGDWDLGGASIELDPNGGGNHALAVDKADEASLTVVLPSVMSTATLRFRALLDTFEQNNTNDYRDYLNVEIQDPASGDVLAVVDRRDSGWPKDVWLDAQGIDLTPWLGGKVKIVFRSISDGDASTSTFFVDDVEVETCLPPDFGPHFTLTSTPGLDGSVIEEGENGNVGGQVQPVVGPNDTIDVGDTANDEQVKGFVSFDTSWLPDGLPLAGAEVLLKLKTNLGGDTQLTLGQCRVDVHHKGGFSLNPALEKGDFEAAATASNVSVLGYASVGEWSHANLFYQPFPNPNWTPPIDDKGVTQVRLLCAKDDDDDQKSDLARYFSSAAAPADRPRLIVEWDPQ